MWSAEGSLWGLVVSFHQGVLGIKVIRHTNKHFYLLNPIAGSTLLSETGFLTGTGHSAVSLHWMARKHRGPCLCLPRTRIVSVCPCPAFYIGSEAETWVLVSL